MRRMMKYLLFIFPLAMFLIACGDGSRASFEKTQTSIELQLNEPVSVYAGDKVQPEDENTTIKVTHEAIANTKTVTLLSGSATLLRGDYVLAN